jgi:predicted GTPase
MMENVIIMGAAGRDFHNFNVCFRGNTNYKVAAFTAAQIPDIEGRLYPPELAGQLYPEGIPIHPEEALVHLIQKHQVDWVVFSYSDLPHVEIMHKASLATAAGANFTLLGVRRTMLTSQKPVVSVCAVRTGCGKSQTTRHVCRVLRDMGKKVVAIRHPMPYGDLKAQVVQRFASYEDFATHQCTIEEREEYEPHVAEGTVVYAGVDYEAILKQAEKEADVIVWDGGNNDTPFYAPDIHIVVLDPHRPGHERSYHPGETNLRMTQIAVINKVDSAAAENVDEVRKNIETYAPDAEMVLAESALYVDDADQIRGKRVLAVEDGPTLTHGEMTFGAGVIAAQRNHAASLVDPRPFITGTIKETFKAYPHIGTLLPAMGYGDKQIRDLEQTINRVDCDLVLFATPIDLPRLISIDKPALRVRYEYKDHSDPRLGDVLSRRFQMIKK